MIAVIDYGMGNLRSVAKALAHVAPEARIVVTGDAATIRSASRVVLPAVYVGPGVAVWLFGRDSLHFGASGLVYGLVSYIFVAGLLRRDRRAIAASLLVAFMYGTLVWGVFPIKVGTSWETHLAAAVIGIVSAIALRARDVPPRKRYSWEDEEDPAATAPDGDEPWRERS